MSLIDASRLQFGYCSLRQGSLDAHSSIWFPPFCVTDVWPPPLSPFVIGHAPNRMRISLRRILVTLPALMCSLRLFPGQGIPCVRHVDLHDDCDEFEDKLIAKLILIDCGTDIQHVHLHTLRIKCLLSLMPFLYSVTTLNTSNDLLVPEFSLLALFVRIDHLLYTSP